MSKNMSIDTETLIANLRARAHENAADEELLYAAAVMLEDLSAEIRQYKNLRNQDALNVTQLTTRASLTESKAADLRKLLVPFANAATVMARNRVPREALLTTFEHGTCYSFQFTARQFYAVSSYFDKEAKP
jgi:hypothetical protein